MAALSLSLNGGNKLGELERLAAVQLLSKLILRLKGLFSFLLALRSARPASSGSTCRPVRVQTGKIKIANEKFKEIYHDEEEGLNLKIHKFTRWSLRESGCIKIQYLVSAVNKPHEPSPNNSLIVSQ